MPHGAHMDLALLNVFLVLGFNGLKLILLIILFNKKKKEVM